MFGADRETIDEAFPGDVIGLVNATALRLVINRPGIFDNVPDHTQTFWGAGFIMPRPFWKIANIGVYYLGFDNKRSIFAKGVGREIRETFGAHIWKRGGRWDYDDEAVFQWGSFRGAPIRAWAFALRSSMSSVIWRSSSADRRPRSL